MRRMRGAMKSKDRQARCIDCSRPGCTNPKCRTCHRCRALTCRGGRHCSGEIRPLQAKQQPKTIAEKHQFRREHCRFPPRSECKKQMLRGSRQRFLASGEKTWTCGLLDGREKEGYSCGIQMTTALLPIAALRAMRRACDLSTHWVWS